jgi:hypothetical protein
MPHTGQQDASVRAFKTAEVVGSLADLVGKSIKDDLSIGGRQTTPTRKRATRRNDGRLDVVRTPLADALVSSNASGEATRRPLMKWSGETATPAI